MVVRGRECCGVCRHYGFVFRVGRIVETMSHCDVCGVHSYSIAAEVDRHSVCDIGRLKRIDPLKEPETVERTEGVTV